MNSNEMPNLAAMRKLMAQEAAIAEANGETPIVGGMGWAIPQPDNTTPVESPQVQTNNNILTTPHISTDGESPNISTTPYVSADGESPNIITTPHIDVSAEPIEEYNGPGLVIDAPKPEQNQIPEYTGISPDTMDSINAYMAEMDEEIAQAQAETERIKEELANNGGIPNSAEKASTVEDEFDKSYNDAVVVIDKIGVGTVIDFTDSERAKLTHAKTIKLNEVETVALNTYQTKKVKKPKDFNNIIKNINTLHTTPICLPMSGYTANIRGCTAYELMGLLETGSNNLLDAQSKWSLIHSKIESTSIGDMDFNEFLFNTAATDYNNFIYGILCATYPENDTISLRCPSCEKQHMHSYSVRQLIRAERMSDALKERFGQIIDASASRHESIKIHEASPVKQVKGIRLPISGIIVEIQVQSAYELINNSIKSISDENSKNAKYRDATVIATLVKRALIDDPEDPDVPYEVTDAGEIAQIIYQLRERDILIIKRMGDELMNDYTIDYGFMKVKCPHCGTFTPAMLVDPEKLLFQRYRQELSASIE